MTAVTGASGGMGSRVVGHLLARAYPPRPVVALARRPDAVPDAPGLTARFADYDDRSSLRAAFADVGTLVFISSDGPAEAMLRHHRNVIAEAVDAGVDHVIYTSIVDVSPDSGFYYAAVHRETEALLAESGLALCVARTSIFADFFLSTWIAPALDAGTLALPAGNGRMSLVSRDDASLAVAVAAVTRHEGSIELTGPAALTAVEICQATEAATGRRLRYVALEDRAYRRKLGADRTPGWLIEAFSSMFASVRAGRFATVSPDIPALTGQPRQTFSEFIHVALGPSASAAPVRQSPAHARRPSVPSKALRPATLADVPRLKALVDAAYQHYVQRIGGPPRPMLDDYDAVVREARVTVAEVGGEIAGLIVLRTDTEAFVVDNVAVDPAHQGTGLGGVLLAFAEAEARRAGFASIHLYTHEKMTENLALYGHLGYVEYDRRQHGQARLVYLRKSLQPDEPDGRGAR